MARSKIDRAYLAAHAGEKTQRQWAEHFGCVRSCVSEALRDLGMMAKDEPGSRDKRAAGRAGGGVTREVTRMRYARAHAMFDQLPTAHQLATEVGVTYRAALGAAKRYGLELRQPTADDEPALRNRALEQGWTVTPLQRLMATRPWIQQDQWGAA